MQKDDHLAFLVAHLLRWAWRRQSETLWLAVHEWAPRHIRRWTPPFPWQIPVGTVGTAATLINSLESNHGLNVTFLRNAEEN